MCPKGHLQKRKKNVTWSCTRKATYKREKNVTWSCTRKATYKKKKMRPGHVPERPPTKKKKMWPGHVPERPPTANCTNPAPSLIIPSPKLIGLLTQTSSIFTLHDTVPCVIKSSVSNSAVSTCSMPASSAIFPLPIHGFTPFEYFCKHIFQCGTLGLMQEPSSRRIRFLTSVCQPFISLSQYARIKMPNKYRGHHMCSLLYRLHMAQVLIDSYVCVYDRVIAQLLR